MQLLPTCHKRQDVVVVHPELVELRDPCMVSFQILANQNYSASIWIRKLLRKIKIKTAAEYLDPICINTIALGLDWRLQHQGKWTSTRFEQMHQNQMPYVMCILDYVMCIVYYIILNYIISYYIILYHIILYYIIVCICHSVTRTCLQASCVPLFVQLRLKSHQKMLRSDGVANPCVLVKVLPNTQMHTIMLNSMKDIKSVGASMSTSILLCP